MKNCELVLGDCLEKMKEMPDNSVDLVLTDPPYSTPVVTSFGRKTVKNFGDLSIQKNFFIKIKEEFERVLKERGCVFIFCDYKYFPILFEVFYSWQTSQLIVWNKGRIGMGRPFRKTYELIYFVSPNTNIQQINGKTYRDIINCKPIHSSQRLVGAEKPVELVKDLIDGFCQKDGVVFDPFMGSGTTGVAALELQRRFVGIEINSDYFEIAKKRIAEWKEQERLF